MALPAPGGAGAAVGVVRNGVLESVTVRGLASLEHQIAVGPHTVFHVASVSKQVTAYAVALLASEDRLDLDAPVRHYLGWFPFDGICIRHLVHHTSGLRDQWELLILAGWRMEDVITTDDIIDLVARQTDLNFLPGTEYAYSNTGYTVLALLVEEITGQSLAEFCRERILAPLGMLNTHFHGDHHRVVADRAESYVPLVDGVFVHVALSYSTVGATSLNTTVGDLARWAAFAMSPEVRPLLEQRHRLHDGQEIDYAFGVMIGQRGGRLMVSHSGGDAGYRTHVATFPAERAAVVVLSNNGAAPVAELALGVADLLFGECSSVESSSWAPDQELLAALAGTYRDKRWGSTHRLILAGGILLLASAMREVPLVPISDGVLGAVGGLGPTFEIFPNAEFIVRMPGISPRRWERLPDRAMEDPAVPDFFIGTFWSSELDSHVRVLADAEDLYLTRPKWGRVRMEPTTPRSFAVALPQGPAAVPADVTFNVEGTALFLTTGRVRRLEYRRTGQLGPSVR